MALPRIGRGGKKTICLKFSPFKWPIMSPEMINASRCFNACVARASRWWWETGVGGGGLVKLSKNKKNKKRRNENGFEIGNFH